MYIRWTNRAGFGMGVNHAAPIELVCRTLFHRRGTTGRGVACTP